MSLKYFSVSVGGDGRYGLLIDPASIHFIDIVSKGDRTITGRRAAILLIALVYQGGDEYLLIYIYIYQKQSIISVAPFPFLCRLNPILLVQCQSPRKSGF